VDHVARRQPVAARHPGGAGLATAQRLAFGAKLLARGAVDRAVDPSAAEQRLVRGVDDGLDVQRRDVGDQDLQYPASELFLQDSLAHGSSPLTKGTDESALTDRIL
jgi:hypothetical protein